MHRRSVRAYSQILLSTVRSRSSGSSSSKFQKCCSPNPIRCSKEMGQFQFQGIKTISGTGMSYPKSPVSVKAKEKHVDSSSVKTVSQSQSQDDNDVSISRGRVSSKSSPTLSPSPSSQSQSFIPKSAITTDEEVEANLDPQVLLLRIPSFMDKKIQNCTSGEEILEMSSSPSVGLKNACLIIFRLGQLSDTDKSLTLEVLQNDVRFVRICNLVQRGDFLQNPTSLFLAIHGMLKLGISTSAELYKSLNSELKWAMRRCPIKHLARAVDLFSTDNLLEKYSGSISKNPLDDPLSIFESAVLSLQRRWVEVSSGTDFILVFKVLQFLNAETREKLEDRAAELVQEFSPQEIRMIFVVLGAQKRRPTPLLRSLAFHFSKAEDSSNAKDLIELTYALNELTFADPILMEKICSNLCPEIPSIDNSALMSSLVTSLGQMRYKNKGLMHIVDEWLMSHLDNLRPFDCASWLLTCAVLNHRSDTTKDFCDKAKSLLSQRTSASHTAWINIVHSLLVLDQHNNNLLASVLHPDVPDFVEKQGAKNFKSKIKLLNINAMAKSRKRDGYNGPFLDKGLESKWSESCLNSSDRKLSSVAVETLNSFMPSEKYLKLNQKLSSGVFADAVCLLSDSLEALPITSTTEQSNSKSKGKPAAMVIEGYSATCLGMKDPTGQTALNRRLLEAEGYHVIPLTYTEFSASEKLIRRVKYIEQKIKSLNQCQDSRKRL